MSGFSAVGFAERFFLLAAASEKMPSLFKTLRMQEQGGFRVEKDCPLTEPRYQSVFQPTVPYVEGR